jgi:hypothetical protein
MTIAKHVATTLAKRVANRIGPVPDPDPDLIPVQKLEVQGQSSTGDLGSFRSGEPNPSIRSAPQSAAKLGIYFRIIDDVLSRERFATLSELVEASKRRCARLRIPYDRGQIQEAVSRMSERRIGLVERPTTPTTTRRADTRPLSRAEARAILEDLGINVREIPR